MLNGATAAVGVGGTSSSSCKVIEHILRPERKTLFVLWTLSLNGYAEYDQNTIESHKRQGSTICVRRVRAYAYFYWRTLDFGYAYDDT